MQIDQALFDQFSDQCPIENTLPYNYCPDCNQPMVLAGIEYQCESCGLTLINESPGGCKDHDETVSGSIKITTGANRGRYYNVTGDYTKTQRKMILDQLIRHSSSFAGPAFPQNILNAVANQYNLIQKMITEDDLDKAGNVAGQKKFVRRGNIKDEVLAGLIYFEGIREKLPRKKKDIACFMGLATCGFARGEDILRNLEAEGKLDIPISDEPIDGFVDRYLEALGMDAPELYSPFIVELVEESERRKIGMSSQVSSKIVAAIYIIITQCKLGISTSAIEKSCDNTKKNTFAKFAKIVFDNIKTFSPIFTKYSIPFGDSAGASMHRLG